MHEDSDGHVHVSEEEASGASKEGVVRWVLILGLILAIGLLSVTWITGALTNNPYEEEGDVSGRMQVSEDDGNATDSIVTERIGNSDDAEPQDGATATPATGVPASGE